MTTPTSIEANKELVRTYTQTVFNEHHTERASDFLAREVKWHGGTLGTRENDSHPRSPPGDEPSRCSRRSAPPYRRP